MEDGFIRLPVGDTARVCGVSEKTVQRAIEAAVSAKLIETRITTENLDGRVIRTRWVKLVTAASLLDNHRSGAIT
jgi:hypothetical protein